MFKSVIAAIGACLTIFSLNVSSAKADFIKPVNKSSAESSNLTKVHHKRTGIRGMLYRRGYRAIYLQSKRYDHEGRPRYTVKACKRGHRVKLKINWLGEIVRRSHVGYCGGYRYRSHRYYRNYGNHYHSYYIRGYHYHDGKGHYH